MKKRQRPISLRLTFWNSIIVALLLGSLTLVFVWWMQLAAQEGLTHSLEADLAVADAQWQVTESLAPAPDGAVLQVLDDQDQAVAQSADWPAGLALPGPETPTGSVQRGEGANYAVGSLALPDGRRLVAALDASTTLNGWQDLQRMLLWVAAIATVLAAAAGYLMARLALRPLEVMVRTAQAIGEDVRGGGLRARMPVRGSGDELERLAETFNEMLDKVESAFSAQTRFLSDASHELRTPVTVISGYANLLRRWGRSDPAVLDEAVQAVVRETDRMSSLLGNLLLLARGEQLQIQREPVALHSVLAAVAQEGAVLAETRAGSRLPQSGPPEAVLRVTAGCPEDLQVIGDSHYLKQALLALVDNAVRHTPAGGQVSIRAQRHATAGPDAGPPSVMITVSDTGTGIPPEHLPHIFERFYRVDPDRSRAAGGSGLGLAIVHWLVELNGGTISVSSAVGHGTTFSIRLPAA